MRESADGIGKIWLCKSSFLLTYTHICIQPPKEADIFKNLNKTNPDSLFTNQNGIIDFLGLLNASPREHYRNTPSGILQLSYGKPPGNKAGQSQHSDRTNVSVTSAELMGAQSSGPA